MIRNLKAFIGALLLMLASINLYAQTDTVVIKTSAICGDCKERIEHDLPFTKGVKSAKLDLSTKDVTIVYNPEKTTVQKIREAITKIGYDADSLKADAKAFNKLPECCQRPMHD